VNIQILSSGSKQWMVHFMNHNLPSLHRWLQFELSEKWELVQISLKSELGTSATCDMLQWLLPLWNESQQSKDQCGL